MDNIFPTINKQIFYPSERKIVSLLRQKADKTCRYKINSEYIKNAFNKFKTGYYYTDNDSNIIGFVLWREYTNIQKDGSYIKKLYIILVCADYTDYKLGKQILYDIDKYSVEHSINIVTLEAANDELVTYYQHGGFLLLNPITKEMQKVVRVVMLDRKSSRTRKIKRNEVSTS